MVGTGFDIKGQQSAIELPLYCVEGGRLSTAEAPIGSLFKQPNSAYLTGEVSVSFEGWLYNRTELLQRLRLSSNSSNAEIVSSLYKQQDANFLKDLEGVFAIGLADFRKNILLLARDPMGVVPLFFSQASSRIFFASSVTPIKNHLNISSGINKEVLIDYVLKSWRSAEETIFTSIQRVLPGHIAHINLVSLNVSQERYWYPVSLDENWVTVEELESFPDVLRAAVTRCMQLGRPALFLSGGIDSGSIALSLSELGNYASDALPIMLHSEIDSEFSESDIQNAITQQLGFSSIKSTWAESAGYESVISVAREQSSHLSMPLCHYNISSYLYLGSRAKKNAADFLMTGEGGDEAMSTSSRFYHLPESLASGNLKELYKVFRHINDYRRGHKERLETSGLSSKVIAKRVFFASALNPLLLKSPQGRTLKRFWTKRKALKRLPNWALNSHFLKKDYIERQFAYSVESNSIVSAQRACGFYDSTFFTTGMEENFELSAKIGLPILQPYNDPKVTSLLKRIPIDGILRAGMSKYPARSYLDQSFPEIGYGALDWFTSNKYIEKYFLSETNQAVKEESNFEILSDMNIIDYKELKREFEQYEDRIPGNKISDMNEIVDKEFWLRNHV